MRGLRPQAGGCSGRFLGVYFTRSGSKLLHTARVLASEPIHPAANLLRIEGRLDFQPGQNVALLLSGSGSPPRVYPGRMIRMLAEAQIPTGMRYLLCGSAEMVVAVRDLLIEKGVPFTDIVGEIFF
jgi:NAD(P)H-flavin reductase